MNSILDQAYALLPTPLQNLAITLFDMQYYRRRGGAYEKLKSDYGLWYKAPLQEIESLQFFRLISFLKFVRERCPFYRERWQDLELTKIRTVSDLSLLPMVTKEEVRENLAKIATIRPREGYAGHTGGTTGKSLTNYYTWEDMQERMAILDSQRQRFGYRLGKRIAWFSGKNIVCPRDEKHNRFWKTDFWFNIRYYSTFHMSESRMPLYIADLEKYQPEYLSGFPSNIIELASFILRKNIKLSFAPEAIFTTSESILPEHVILMERAWKSKVVDHYSSSEGAPWVQQCEFGKYHYIMPSGVIEVLDENDKPAVEGEMVVTSFATRGTPLVRYRIGDRMRWAAEKGAECACGSCLPVVEKIEGRKYDYIYSKERGKIGLGNVSNCIKYGSGVIKFQVVQNELDRILVKMVVDKNEYTPAMEGLIKNEFEARLGRGVQLDFQYLEDIPREKSGKYMIVKNNIAHLLET